MVRLIFNAFDATPKFDYWTLPAFSTAWSVLLPMYIYELIDHNTKVCVIEYYNVTELSTEAVG